MGVWQDLQKMLETTGEVSDQSFFDTVNNIDSWIESRNAPKIIKSQETPAVVEHPDHITKAVEFLKQKEDFKPWPYKDAFRKRPDGTVIQQNAIGFGSSIDPRTNQPVAIGIMKAPLTKEQAEGALFNKVYQLDNQLEKKVSSEMSPFQRAAVLSKMYHAGDRQFLSPETTEALNQQDWSAVAEKIMQYKYTTSKSGKKIISKGLVNRAAEEVNLLRTPWQPLEAPSPAPASGMELEIQRALNRQITPVINTNSNMVPGGRRA